MASGGMQMDAAVLMSASLEGILNGFSILMFICTILALTHNRRAQNINRPLAVAILLLILSTAHMVVNIIRIEDGLVNIATRTQAGHQHSSQTFLKTKHAIYVMQTLLADGVVFKTSEITGVPRLVKDLSLLCCLAICLGYHVPFVLWCSVGVTGVYAVYSCSQTNSSSIFTKSLAQWVTAFLALTIATNLLSSGLLAYRIWTIECAVSIVRASNSNVMPVIRVLTDAACLYSMVLFIALVCFVCSNYGEMVVVDMAMPIMSIAFYMVLIRVAINRNTPSDVSTTRGISSEAEQGGSPRDDMKPSQIYVHSRLPRRL